MAFAPSVEPQPDADSTAASPSPYLLRVSDTIKAYRLALRGLLGGKFQGVVAQLPAHLRGPSSTFVLQCTDGILVRTDAAATTAEAKVRCAMLNESMAEAAPKFSEFVLHFPVDLEKFDPGPHGVQLTMEIVDFEKNTRREVGRMRWLVAAASMLPTDYVAQPTPARPPCLVSLANEIEFHMGGTIESAEPEAKREVRSNEQFIGHGRSRLPVGWESFEAFPLGYEEHWNPSHAPLWAECELYAWIARENATGLSLCSLDGRGALRDHYAAVLREFERLLDGAEEPMHQFLKKHPNLLNPAHDKCWSKVPFGDRFSDFVFREPHNDYELVEIEAPHRELFREDGQQRQELTHAINQLLDWVGYIQENKARVEEELGFSGISTNPRCLVVIGRSSSLSEADRRKLVTTQAQHNKLRILTYDDVLANARSHLERIVGPLGMIGTNLKFYFFQDQGSPP